MTSILLVDDHQILLDGINELISKSTDLKVFATADTGTKALDLMRLHGANIDLIITDISLPDMKGYELAEKIKVQNSEVKIIALSMHEERHIIKDSIKSGIAGYVLKKSTHDDLLQAIASVMNGVNYVSPSITHMMIEDIRNPSLVELLSDREKQIILLITKEYTTRKIAQELFISEKTVETHKTNIFRKTNTSTLVGLTKFAIEHQLD
ncbi:MAG: response regulator transcription factor [Cyclobacteriaceae bacterium]